MIRAIQAFFRHLRHPSQVSEVDTKVFDHIKPGDIAIDCGAHLGVVSAVLSRKGARVYAFEPNPYAFQKLNHRFKDNPNVTCINKGVWIKNDRLPLYLHKLAWLNQAIWSVGSSLDRTKKNVRPASSVMVDVVDLAEFIKQLQKPIALLKMDIEGAECDVLAHLISSGAIHKIAQVIVETHAGKIPHMNEKLNQLKQRIQMEHIQNISLDWH